MEASKKFIKTVINILKNNKLFFFIFFIILNFIIFRDLFFSYFEADEWFHYTYYFPLTQKPDGLLTAFTSTFVNSGVLSGGQHVVPIASVIFFLNTKFLGLNYAVYAFMSLLLHSINSFLIFYLLKISLKNNVKNIFFGFISGIFFALSPTAIHTWTGAAPFYGQNILSVTFFLLCIIYLKLAFINKTKNFIYFSAIFLLFSIFTKETSAFLFLLLPILIFFEKKIFPLKFLLKIFVFTLVIFVFIRFVPQIPSRFEKVINSIVDKEIKVAYNNQNNSASSIDTGTIVSEDLSIYKNLPAEIVLRSVTFPLRMMGTLFIPRETTFSIVKLITPIIVPVPPGGDVSSQMGFIYGSGNFVVIYLVSIGIFIFCISSIRKFIKNKHEDEARIIILGISIVVLSALPLVAIIFSFPRWGYDFYFDSRFYYNPNVGAAIIFPFLLFEIAKLISKVFRIKSIKWSTILLFIVWFIYNYYILSLAINYFINKYSSDRREVVKQITTLLPRLHERTIFYIETDGKSAYGPMLPFQTGVAQALSVIYYNRNTLPDSFYNKPILGGKPEGYQYENSRGFGYYTSKKTLAEDLLVNKFRVDDIYSYYYFAEKVKLIETTSSTRKEMRAYLKEKDEAKNWKSFEILSSVNENIRFLYPSDSEIIDYPIATTEAKILRNLQINNYQSTINLKVIHTTSTFDINELISIVGKVNNFDSPIVKRVSLDAYHFNDAFTFSSQGTNYYFLKFNDLLVYAIVPANDELSISTLEKILGSFYVFKQK